MICHKHRFVMQPLQNPPTCRCVHSTQREEWLRYLVCCGHFGSANGGGGGRSQFWRRGHQRGFFNPPSTFIVFNQCCFWVTTRLTNTGISFVFHQLLVANHWTASHDSSRENGGVVVFFSSYIYCIQYIHTSSDRGIASLRQGTKLEHVLFFVVLVGYTSHLPQHLPYLSVCQLTGRGVVGAKKDNIIQHALYGPPCPPFSCINYLYNITRCLFIWLVLLIHPQNVRFQNVRFQNVRFTKRQVSKRLISKRPVLKFIYLLN